MILCLNNLLLKLDQLGFQPSKQERLELSGLTFQSIIVSNLLLKLDKLGFQTSKREISRQELSGLIRHSMIHS